jgi:hypothetical protein
MFYFNCLRLNCVQCLCVYHSITQGRMQAFQSGLMTSLHHSPYIRQIRRRMHTACPETLR